MSYIIICATALLVSGLTLFSGFFGGLSGHQGALRSAFLTKTGVSPQAFVGTNAVIGFMVDMVRMMPTVLGGGFI